MNTQFKARVAFLLVALLGLAVTITAFPTSQDNVWTPIDKNQLRPPGFDSTGLPNAYETFRLNKPALRAILDRAPEEFSGGGGLVLSMPMPDGTFSRFRIEHSLVVEPGLLVGYPELGATYRGYGIDDPTASARFDFLPSGFHSIILSSKGTVYIDPFERGDTDNYISFFKTDRSEPGGFHCLVDEGSFDSLLKTKEFVPQEFVPQTTPEVINGTTLRTYRLALAASWEYCNVFGNTVASCLAAQVVTMNRVNGVYERDLALRMVTIANNNLIVYAADRPGGCGGVPCTAANDPYSNSDGFTMLGQNQSNLDSVIGSANYDIGHVFSTGGGGVASLFSPCAAGAKARGVTGLPNPIGDPFAIDFVAHEMGHQYGAQHTFNGSNGNCSGGNRSGGSAYEPGSGITVMAYAGICGAQNLANFSLDTFHVKSLEAIVAFKEAGGNCGPATATGNTPPAVTGPGNFNIPKQTPFALTASATDPNGDTLTYDWQEYDLGPASPPDTDADGFARPIFRPYLPSSNGTRTFPSLQFILNNANVPPPTTGGFLTGEILPSIARTMNFQVVVRDSRANGGGINTATSVLTVSATSGPFNVTTPNTGLTWAANSSQIVTWSVANTNVAPVNAANVKISLSIDGGQTFPTTILASTPNDGFETITVPNNITSTARIKVEAVGNIFFDISNVNFTIAASGGSISAAVQTNPTGLSFTVDGSPFSAVQVLQWTPGSSHTIATTTPQTLSGTTYNFTNWSDGGAISHIVAPTVSTIYTANFTACTYSLMPTSQNFPLGGGNNSVQVNTQAACPWTAVVDPRVAAWITITSGSSGTGSGIVNYSVAANGTGSPRTGTINIAGQTFTVNQSNTATLTRAPFDYDGDNKTDLSIFRPAVGEWWINRSMNGSTFALQFGASTDKLTPGDYTGDGKTDIAFFRPSTGFWFVLRSEDFSFFSFPFGANGDVPVPGNYDADNLADAAVFRPSTLNWFILKSTGGTDIFTFGAAGDKPAVADYDGDSLADIAIFRPGLGEWWVRRSSNQTVFALQFGSSTDKPVQGDYTGDSRADIAFWRPSTGFWFILRSEDFSFFSFPFGGGSDIPVPGDYDGDGRFDAGIFRPSETNWYVLRSGGGTLIQQFGAPGDLPTPNAFVP